MRHPAPKQKSGRPKGRRYHQVDVEPLSIALIELPDWVAGAD